MENISQQFDVEKFLQTPNKFQLKQEEYHKVSIAPMLDVTNRYFRVFLRLLTRKTTLWTEMIHCETIIYNPDKINLLKIDPIEKPVIL